MSKLKDLIRFLRKHVSWQAVATAVICCIFIVFFFRSRLHRELEDFWFDQRMQVKPQIHEVKNVKIISLDSLESRLPLREESGIEKIDIVKLIAHLRLLRKFEFKKLVLLTFENTVDFNAANFSDLLKVVREDPRIYWGTLSFQEEIINEVQTPPLLNPIGGQLVGVDLFRDRSISVVRKFPIIGYQGTQQVPMLASKIDPSLLDSLGTSGNRLYFNFVPSKYFSVFDIREVAANIPKYRSLFKDDVLVAGSLKYREWATTTSEPTKVNTSIRQDINNVYDKGESLTFVVANLVDNVMTSRYLRSAHWFARVPQCIGLFLLVIMFFRWSVTTSLVVYCLYWFGVVYTHSIFYELFSLSIPLSGEFMLLTMGLLVGIWNKSDKNARNLFAGYLTLEGKRSEFALENSFFKEFSQELALQNSKTSVLSHELEKLDLDPSNAEIYAMLKDVQSDFSEYLEGVKQVANVDDEIGKKVVAAKVSLFDFVSKINKRFSIFCTRNSIKIENCINKSAVFYTDGNILDAILHNLISNAVKYSPTGSTVEVSFFQGAEIRDAKVQFGIDKMRESTQTIWKNKIISKTINREQSGEQIGLFIVSDRGPGVPEDKVSLIFEKFYRIKDDGVYRVKGTGLGLYLCRFFAEQIGGRVDYHPRAGGGSLFILEIGG